MQALFFSGQSFRIPFILFMYVFILGEVPASKSDLAACAGMAYKIGPSEA